MPDWLVVVLVVAGAVATALAVGTSKYRKAADREREKYIRTLEDSNNRREADLKDLRAEHNQLKGTVDFMKNLLLGKCAFCEIDDRTGGCKNCGRHLLYGQPATKSE